MHGCKSARVIATFTDNKNLQDSTNSPAPRMIDIDIVKQMICLTTSIFKQIQKEMLRYSNGFTWWIWGWALKNYAVQVNSELQVSCFFGQFYALFFEPNKMQHPSEACLARFIDLYKRLYQISTHLSHEYSED